MFPYTSVALWWPPARDQIHGSQPWNRLRLCGPLWPFKPFLYESIHICMRAMTCVFNCVQYALKALATKAIAYVPPPWFPLNSSGSACTCVCT